MLSRIAESLFWIGRYIERAEATARILDVHLQLLVEDPVLDRDATCQSLLAAMAVGHDGPADVDEVLRYLLTDSQQPSAIAYALTMARDNARRSREIVSTELWEALNTTHLQVADGQLASMRPADAFRLVRERANMIAALADNTQSHDDGWQFIRLGRMIERVDMTARVILMTTYGTGSAASWQVTLRACGAAHAFTRIYRASESPRSAAEFLLQDRLFPRSVRYSLNEAATCLEELNPKQHRTGFSGDARRIVGQALAQLEYRSISDLLGDVASEMESLQRVCAQATEAVSKRYFEGALPPEWIRGES
ncbi:alpha-E domain-containing protein [Yimella sp. RIT 621]|uniref:Putative alpha-E superfamily protein n=1 Tax=Yimella lutea TaxID=587872 RepID=A0A542EDL7_9MICO|nr:MULTISPECIES: alpha-E domain-containing protein [Yimella]RYG77480.1 alpha-E domain-containing protein [Yimella sp. RIT 621]TQJ13419.1 putative alpha-E superfamily protein [Yimella lutea]